MKIHIIGPSGSGKTYLSKQLAEKYQIPAYALDDLFWDNSRGSFNTKREPAVRDAMLDEILQTDSWIIEGVQYAWVTPCFAQADVIYLLETPALLCRFRIVRRFIKRKLNKTGRKNETLKSLCELLTWTKKFYKVNLPAIKNELQKYSDKVIVLTGKKDIQKNL